MEISTLAGKPASRNMLVDLALLEGEYYTRRPDVGDPNQLVSFGTSGHRGSSLRGTFTEAHILAITQAVCDYRRSQRIDEMTKMSDEVAWELIRLAWSSVAALAMAPLQDLLDLGAEARMNLTGSVEGNWRSFLVHWEGNNNLHRTLQRIKALGKGVGVVINPATPAAVLEEVLPEVDLVLVMTVNPGFGHQHFLHTALPKIRRVRQMIEQTNPACELELDGGIDATTAPLGVAAGANVLVAGSAIFGDGDGVTAAMNRLRAATKQAVN